MVSRTHITALLLSLLFLASCRSGNETTLQGYVEGEFVYIASPFAGALETLNVKRGMQVKLADPLYSLDSTVERASLDEAKRKLAQAQANLEDLKKGMRPTELQALEAQLKQAQAEQAYSEREFARLSELIKTRAASPQDFDRARSARDKSKEQVAELEAELKTAQLGSRADQIVAAQANSDALEASVRKSDWELAQKAQRAPKAGLVFDTLYREGEWVGAGKPVVVILPPENIKVRTFVSETILGALHVGQSTTISVDASEQTFTGKISFISPQAEYTPPVIFSKESRAKLVFLVEIVFDTAQAMQLHPGQPVDVSLGE